MNAIVRTGTVFLVAASLFTAGCGPSEKSRTEGQLSKKTDTADFADEPARSGTAGGLRWEIPHGWTIGESNQMRAATYIIAPAAGDNEHAECAVFYFSAGQGGTVQANIDRWIGQMEQPDGSNSADKAKMSHTKINGLKFSLLDISGTYRLAAGPMMQLKEKKPGYRMIGAIAEGPEGPVFFKFVGPSITVEKNYEAFMTMINSVSTD